MVLSKLNGFYWVLLGFYCDLARFDGILISFSGLTGFWMIWMGSDWVLLGFTGFLPGFTGFKWVLIGFDRFLPGFGSF